MESGWWSRFAVIGALILVSIWVLLPSVVGEDIEELNRRKAESVSGGGELAVEGPSGWRAYLPNTRLNLGIDLQGGVDMTLAVETDEAILSTVSRDVASVEDAAKRDGVTLTAVRRVRGEAALEIDGGATSLEQVSAFVANRFGNYGYVSTTVDGAVSWHRYALREEEAKQIADQAVNQALETMRTRVDATGVKEPSIQRKGESAINVQLPGQVNLQDAVAALGTTAVLEFMLVDEDFDMADLERSLQAAKEALPPADYADDELLNEWLVETGRIGGESRLMWEYAKDPNDAKAPEVRSQPYVLKDQILLTGDDVNDAQVAMDQYNTPYTALEFKPRGAQIFADVTGENIGKRFAIVLDKKVRSAPVIRDKIAGGRASIEMGAGNISEALRESQTLSLVLRTGALPAPVTVAEVRTIGASLGQDAVQEGVKAALFGAGIVVFFMTLYYRRAGLVADVALALNVLFMMALLAMVGATLTLPGIAGIALTVGMAVDANIIIYERIREEVRLGKGPKAAVEAGFENALSAIFDGNVTTAIAGVVLYSYGSGPIKGFAVTLLIGIATTLFSAVYVTRTLLVGWVRRANDSLVF